ncbi:hypothetical protein MTO96_049167 [Rhipicephalus appendiculatus]
MRTRKAGNLPQALGYEGGLRSPASGTSMCFPSFTGSRGPLARPVTAVAATRRRVYPEPKTALKASGVPSRRRFLLASRSGVVTWRYERINLRCLAGQRVLLGRSSSCKAIGKGKKKKERTPGTAHGEPEGWFAKREGSRGVDRAWYIHSAARKYPALFSAEACSGSGSVAAVGVSIWSSLH